MPSRTPSSNSSITQRLGVFIYKIVRAVDFRGQTNPAIQRVVRLSENDVVAEGGENMLGAGERLPEEDLHLSNQTRSQTHRHWLKASGTQIKTAFATATPPNERWVPRAKINSEPAS